MPSEYEVKKGDTLWSIAKKHNVSLQELKKANPQVKRPDQILPGDKVIIPNRQLGNKEVGATCEPCQAKKTCIKIILLDEERYPYLGETCQIKKKNKLVREEKLNEQGKALFQAVQAGSYLVEFPQFKLDKVLSRSQPVNEEQPVECGTLSQKQLNFKELTEPLKLNALSTEKTHEIIVHKAREFILLVGTEQHYNAYALKMMFFAPAVRDIKSGRYQYDVVTIVYFDDGYNGEEIQAVQSSVSEQKVNLVPVKTVTDMLTYLNKLSAYHQELKKEVPRKIARVHIYAHGFPGEISFGLDGENRSKQKFMMSDVTKLEPNNFASDAKLWSYACRTGNGARRDKEFFKNDAEALSDKSLAQTIANHLNIEVYAWLTRTNYFRIWDDQGDEVYQQTYIDLKHKGLQKEGHRWWDVRGWGSAKDHHALWNQNGAYGEIMGGDTPLGLSNSPRTFLPSHK